MLKLDGASRVTMRLAFPSIASLLVLLAIVSAATAHEGTGSHEAISGRIEPKGAWSWTVDEPTGLSYFVDTSAGRQGALRILEDDDSAAKTHTIRIAAGDGEPVRLEPQDLTVRFGDKVTWVNDDTAAHTLVGTTGVYREPEVQPGKGIAALGVVAVTVGLAGALLARRRAESP